jgi:hypothetical protein
MPAPTMRLPKVDARSNNRSGKVTRLRAEWDQVRSNPEICEALGET